MKNAEKEHTGKMLNYRSTHQFVTTLNIIFALYIVDHSL
jgi:hypothetical protein